MQSTVIDNRDLYKKYIEDIQFIQYLQENPVDNIDQLAQRMAEFKGEENKFLSTLSKYKKDEEQLGFSERLKLLRKENKLGLPLFDDTDFPITNILILAGILGVLIFFAIK